MTSLLDIRGLTVRFATRHGAFTAVDGIDIRVERDEVLAIDRGQRRRMTAIGGQCAIHDQQSTKGICKVASSFKVPASNKLKTVSARTQLPVVEVPVEAPSAKT